SDLTRGGVQSEHTPLHQRIGRRKSAHKTLAVGIAGVKEADFWLLHHSAQMFRNRARLRGDRRQRAKIVFIAGCEMVSSRASPPRGVSGSLVFRRRCVGCGAEQRTY